MLLIPGLNRVFCLNATILISFAIISLTPFKLQAQEPLAPCVVDIPVYGPSGERLSFKVTQVYAAGDKNLDFLSTKLDGVTTTVEGDRVMFSSDRIVNARAIEVTLRGPKDALVTTRFVVTSCRFRNSIFYSQRTTGMDVAGNPVFGRLTGCKFAGDWWLRAVPLFGGQDRGHIADGFVQSDGYFYIVLGDYGVRHIFVIGKGNEPIRVFAANITSGKKFDLGVIDLHGECPGN